MTSAHFRIVSTSLNDRRVEWNTIVVFIIKKSEGNVATSRFAKAV